MNKLLKNKYIQWSLILIAGVAIGAVFYPSKTIREEEQQKYERLLNITQAQHSKMLLEQKESFNKEVTAVKEKLEETTNSIHTLKTENTELRQKAEEGTLKIVKPDGTIIEKTYKKTETEQISKVTTEIKAEFTRKVKSIESKWMKLHKERLTEVKKSFDSKMKLKESEIFELKKTRTVEINKKSFGLAVGYLTNNNYYTSIDYTIFGPVFIDIHTQSDFADEFSVGGGIGIKF